MPVQEEVPKSRITMVCINKIHDEPPVFDLPLCLILPEDFSKESSEDPKQDLDQKNLRSLDGSNMID